MNQVFTDMPTFRPDTHVLVASLGAQPQVCTAALDILLVEKRVPIGEVVVIHPANPDTDLQQALTLLRREFEGGWYDPRHYSPEGYRCGFTSFPLRYGNTLIDDIVDEASADATLDSMYRLLKALKEQGCHVHFSAGGGRAIMSMQAQYLSSLLFSTTDRLWKLHTPRKLQEQADRGRIMHFSPGDGVSLFPVRFFPLTLMPVAHLPSDSARAQQLRLEVSITRQERVRCQWVIDHCTEAERRVLRAYAEGMSQQQVKGSLIVSENTVRKHTKKLLALARAAWELAPEEPVTYHFLYKAFHVYFEALAGPESDHAVGGNPAQA
jgi:CRISPR-associated protein Csx14